MESIIEQIAEVIRVRLAASLELNGVVRPQWINQDPAGDLKITLTQGSREPNEQLSVPGNPPASAYDQTFLINVELRPSETDERAINTHQNEAIRLIRYAIADGVDWHTMDGLAIDSLIGGAEIMRDDSSASISIPLMVRYRHSEYDETVLR